MTSSPADTETLMIARAGDVVALAGDHAGPALLAELEPLLQEMGFQTLNLGTNDSASVDYPDYADKLAHALAEGRAVAGVLVCGSGIGISIAANRHAHVRAALISEPLSAHLAREHNNANVIAMGARLTGPDMAAACVRTFFTTPFSGGERHVRRVGKMGGGA